MKTRPLAMLLSVAVVSGTGAFAQALPRVRQSDEAAPSDAPQGTGTASTTLRMRGTIDKYDASTRMLSFSTSNGTMRLLLASTARIRRGEHTVDASELQKLSGYTAVVRYSESDGNKTVESVHVLDKARG